MTSSLVGSEMCIRDSFKTTGQSKSREAHVRQDAQPSKTLNYVVRYLFACLLYTSDAADDM
eukprot:318493-Prorocentrum_lima.AAC.1